MQKNDIYGHIFQCFSALSDAQDLIAINRFDVADKRVNHAKLHLLAIIKADRQGFADAMRDLPMSCTLESNAEKEKHNGHE